MQGSTLSDVNLRGNSQGSLIRLLVIKAQEASYHTPFQHYGARNKREQKVSIKS